MGMSFDDFRKLTPDEFNETCRSWNEWQASLQHSEWERMRLMTTMLLQPHSKKRLDAKTILPFPWERKSKKEMPQPSKEERHKRFQKLMQSRSEG